MKNFMKPIINAIKYWTNSRIEDSKSELNSRIDNSQSDWNENNSSSDGYIKNRPFYTSDPVETVLIEEQTFTIDENEGIGFITSTCPLEAGQEYAVTLDGTTYNYMGENA